MKKLIANNKVAIVGRPNVGKSTLFNRLVGRRMAIVHDSPGVTRDRLYEVVSWNGKKLNFIDTGGIEISDKPFAEQIKIQAEIAIEEAGQIIFLVDGTTDLTDSDFLIANILRKSHKPIFVASNKLEANRQENYDVYQLGFENFFNISALHGERIGNLLDVIVENIDFDQIKEQKLFKLSIIGKPNAGKSSLLNTILKRERAIVSPIAGTTRDSIKETFFINEEEYYLIDTAGISRKSRLVESVDHYALMRALDSLGESNLTIVLIDATIDITRFDARVIGYAYEQKKPIIIAINKWDLIEKETNTMSHYQKALKEKFPFISWVPIVFLSALKNQRIPQLLNMVSKVRKNLTQEIKPMLLNELVIDMQMMQPAPSFNGGHLQIYHAIKTGDKIPTFIFFVNDIRFLHFSYERYVENQLREYFDFTGAPLNLIFKKRT